MQSGEVYIPIDRRIALASGVDLLTATSGATLFADISGFTPMTETLVRRLGARRGAEELTYHLNRVYDALIAEVHRYHGSVVGFSGDAITCWFDQDNGLRAAASALAMQQAMQQFASFTIPTGDTMSLTVKAALAVGGVRRFVVGIPSVQYIDVLAGETLDRMAAGEHVAGKGEVVLDPVTMQHIGDQVQVAEWRENPEIGLRFAVITALHCTVAEDPWTEGVSSSTAGEGESPALAEDQVRQWLLRPVYERLKSGQGMFLAEIRPAVPLFLRFSGIDYDNDPESGSKLDAYIRWVQSVLTRYEGFLIQLTVGDKGSYLYAAFGAPIAHEDDPQRAVAAALELRSPPDSLSYISPVQIGITRGQMRTGAYGSSTRRTYGVLGDEVNLAARLMANVEPGQIMVSQRIVAAASDRYQFASRGEICVKGKRDPVAVSLVVGQRLVSQQRTLLKSASPLIGRESELSQMEQWLEPVQHGQGQIICLEGDAGLGKSHLAAEFALCAVRQGMQLFSGACQSINQGVAYTPWRQIFRAFFALSDEHVADEGITSRNTSEIALVEMMINQMNPDWNLRLPVLGDLLGLPIPENETTATFEPQQRQEALLTLAVEILQTWSGDIPMLIIIEDAHWIDESSLGLAQALCRVISHVPLLLLFVQRPLVEDTGAKGYLSFLRELSQTPCYHRMDLGELSPEAVGGLVANQLGGHPSELALSLIQRQAQGNPFFVGELVHTLRETGQLYEASGHIWTFKDTVIDALLAAGCLTRNESGERVVAPNAQLSAVDLGIPDSVQGVVLSRIDRLPENHKMTLKVASVIGRIFALSVLTRAHPTRHNLDALLNEFTMLETREFTFQETPLPHPAYIFKHQITQEVAYGTMLEVQQRELHRLVAETLESLSPDDVEQLAYHYSRSGVRDKTLLYLDKAAHKAQHDYANETALTLYQQALDLEERWEWRKGQIEVLHILGRHEEQVASLHALDALPDAPLSETAYLWGQYYEAISDYPRALAAAERALAASSEAQQIRCLLLGAHIYYVQGQFEQAQAWAERGLAAAEKQSNRGEQARALQALGILYQEQGKYTQGIDVLEHACKQYEQENRLAGLNKVLSDLGFLYEAAGRWQDATASFERSIQISRSIGNVMTMGHAYNNLAILVQNQGNLEQASSLFQQSRQQFERAGSEKGIAFATLNRAEVLLLQHMPTEALVLLEESMGILERINVRIAMPETLRLMSEAYLEYGDVVQAHSCATRALDMAQELGLGMKVATVQRTLGKIALHQHDIAQAGTCFDQSATVLDQQGEQYELGKTLYWQARLAHASGDEAGAASLLARAEKIFTDLHSAYDLALVQELQHA